MNGKQSLRVEYAYLLLLNTDEGIIYLAVITPAWEIHTFQITILGRCSVLVHMGAADRTP